ncbi:MAG: saccharopine dehydrogenase NADP-binding domain-containing protein [Massilia sp.]
MNKLMIYGATGYTGRMAAERAAASGTPLVLAGRSAAALVSLAASLGVEYRVFPLDDIAEIDRSLRGVGALLNCAGPFARTADVLMRACIRNGVHYLDVAAELDGYRLAEVLDVEAKAAGVMLLPGSGGSVAMLGCLAGHTVARTSNPSSIRVAMHVSGGLSRGSAVSAMGSITSETLARVDGTLVARSAGAIRKLDFGMGPVNCFQVTLPDLITIWRSTGVPDIEAFVHVTGDGFPQGDLSALPDGPSDQERLANRYQAVAEVTGADGDVVRSILDTVNGYTFTATAAAEAGRRVLAGEDRRGFQTPALLFGNGFAETIADTTIVDV